MKVVICGQRKFGFEVLKLCEQRGFEIVLVVVPDDDRVMLPYAEEKGYQILPPYCITDRMVQPDFEFDLGITAHFFGKVPDRTINQAKIGWLGYHPSLLPRHRGRSAIEWALRMKDVITGGSLYWLDGKMDHGDLCIQDWIFLDHNLTAKEVWDQQLMPMGLRLFALAFDMFAIGNYNRIPQAPLLKFATHEPGL